MLRCMRTTLTLDDDVAAQLSRLQKQKGLGFKSLVNLALRSGLAALERDGAQSAQYRVEEFDCGPCLLGDIISVSDTIAAAEGEWHR